MSTTLPEFLVITAVGIAAGWLWTESAFLRWPRGWLWHWFPEHIQDNQGLAGWISAGLHCPACTGFWPQLTGMLIIEGASWWAPALALAALVAHLAWLNVTGALIASILR